jgi:folylpolyglutamate synthase/dihydropteroate synthase
MKDFGAHETVFAMDAQVMEPEHEVGIFMSPSLKGFVESIDIGKVVSPDAKVTAAYAMPAKVLFYPE